METPKTRLSKVLGDFNARLARADEDTRNKLRAALGEALSSSAKDDKVDGTKLLSSLGKVGEAISDEGLRQSYQSVVERLHEERQYRGEMWLRDSLHLTLADHLTALDSVEGAAPSEEVQHVGRRRRSASEQQ